MILTIEITLLNVMWAHSHSQTPECCHEGHRNNILSQNTPNPIKPLLKPYEYSSDNSMICKREIVRVGNGGSGVSTETMNKYQMAIFQGKLRQIKHSTGTHPEVEMKSVEAEYLGYTMCIFVVQYCISYIVAPSWISYFL